MFPKKIADQIRQEVKPLETGFHLFTAKENKHSYFYYVQASKKILLISKAYQQARSAENALSRILQQEPALSYQSVTHKNKKQRHYLQLLDGNKKAMAVSRPFADLEEAELAAKGLQAKLEQGREASETKTASPVEQPQLQHSARRSFRLDFYPHGDPKQLKGQIEFLLTREKKKIIGLDLDAIQDFITAHLGLESDTEEVVERKTPVLPTVNNNTLLFNEMGQNTPSTSFAVGTPMEVSVTLSKNQYDGSSVTIYLRSLGSSDKLQLAKGEVRQATGELKVPVYTQELTPGFYQVIATLQPTSLASGNSVPLYQASSIVQLYEA
ncbi:MAG: hypothetical protein KTR30_30350 [Saprospiraceae bacterium]|nr:hypothetical protein [Saprospiraceae bacterium]